MIEAGPFADLRDRGAKEERAAIVAWLRDIAERNTEAGLDAAGSGIRVLADAIERGDHLKDSTP